MITILDGNAFYLRITGKTKVGEYEATLDLEAIDSLIVNFVRRVRESQTVTHDQGKVLAYNDGKLAKGVYGVEMVGYYNGQPWRFYAPDVFEIADDGETEASNVIGSVNVYDVTFYMKLGGDGVTPGYVDAAVTMHNTSEEAHSDMREAITGLRTKVEGRITDVMVVGRDGSETSMSEYDEQGNKVVKLPQDSMGKVDGVKVNGTELEVDASGKVDITIPQSVHDLDPEDDYATKEYTDARTIGEVTATVEVGGETKTATVTKDGSDVHIDFPDLQGQQGERGNGITSITQTTVASEDGSKNIVNIKTTDNPQGVNIEIKNGSQGRPGADRQPVEAGDVIIAHGTGNSEKQVMSQKAVTEAINTVKEVLGITSAHHATDFTGGTRLVSSESGEISSTSSIGRYANEINISVDTYEVKYPCRSFSGNYGYAFVKDNGQFVSGAQDTANAYRTIGRSEILTAIAAGATKLRITIRDSSSENIGYDIKVLDPGVRLDEIESAVNDVKDDVDAIEDAISVESFTYDVDITGGYRVVSSDTGEISSTSSSGRYANEINIDDTFQEIACRSPKFNGNYGFAFVDDNGDYISGRAIPDDGESTKSVDVTITRNEISTAIANGATKIRISFFQNVNYKTYTIKKSSHGLRIDTLEEKMASVNGEVATLNEKVTELESRPKHYNVIGSPTPYVSATDATGLSWFNNLSDLYGAFDALVANHPDWMSKEEDLGMDASNTYAIRHYCLRYQHPMITTDREGENTNTWSDSTYKPRRIIVNMSVHSMERLSTLGAYLAIKEILESSEPWAMFIKNNFVLDIVPCLNPWGLENGSSNNSNDYNLNRTYFENVQSENECMINLVQSLKSIGLVGIIDCHNCSSSHGYLVSKRGYTLWNYYAILTQQIASLMYASMTSVFGTGRDNHFHLWDATGTDGQLHQYANSQGLLGCTFEVFNGGYDATKALRGSLITKSILINIIQLFGVYE